jgi:hypothetical protein
MNDHISFLNRKKRELKQDQRKASYICFSKTVSFAQTFAGDSVETLWRDVLNIIGWV